MIRSKLINEHLAHRLFKSVPEFKATVDKLLNQEGLYNENKIKRKKY